MASEHHTRLNYTGSGDFAARTYSRDHEIVFESGQTLLGSAAAGYAGNPAGVDPEQLLAQALSSCHCLTFLAVAANRGYVIRSYRDHATALLDKNADGKPMVTKIVLRPTVEFDGTTPDGETLRKMHDRAHAACFIGQSIRSEVVVEL